MWRAFGLLAVLAMIAGAAGTLWFKTPLSDTFQITRQLRNVPALEGYEIELESCTLTLSHESVDADRNSARIIRSLLDLSQYDLTNVRIQSLTDGSAIYSASPRRATPEMAREAMRVIALLPDSFSSKETTLTLLGENGAREVQETIAAENREAFSLETVRELLAKPDQTLTFWLNRFVLISSEGGEPEIHPDAPDFDRFATSVLTLDPPVSTLVMRNYLSKTEDPTRLLSGQITVFPTLDLQFKTQDDLMAFGQRLAGYQRRVCPVR
ncbi:hypothetical protein [uncultured Celeribacter sp.]|uniref:hypothetical protein n=1 Tax=uncultured Celeribacter sp. TaxID=1303376 RepID=UPI002AA76EF2|nr:hypothetical protein [uncultured Celeribacter sp.]